MPGIATMILIACDLADGAAMVRRLKDAPPVTGIPVIMLTGQGEKNVIVESLAAGAAAFVVKPFDRDVLLKKVARFAGA
jgi:CheY-like chemotaxis protein